jgi:hypothetical protein
MTKSGCLCGLVLVSIPLACSSKSAMKLSTDGDAGKATNGDAEHADASTITPDDAKATVPDVWGPADLAWVPDVVTSTPDIGKPDGVSPAADLAPDLSRRDDIATVVQADGKTPPDATVVQLDGKVPPDATVVQLDGKVPPDATADTVKADSTKDLGPQGDARLMVSGVEVVPYENYGPADAACVQGTSSWLDGLTTYLAEDRRCFADSDCQYVSFSNACGQVCPVPMNTQRIGEFGQHAIGDFDPKCSSCPVLTDYPSCPTPPGDGSVICNNNLCIWK